MEAGLGYPQNHLVVGGDSSGGTLMYCVRTAPQDQQPKLSRTGSLDLDRGALLWASYDVLRMYDLFLGVICSEAGSKERRAIFCSEGFRRMIVWVSWRSVGTVCHMAGRVQLWVRGRVNFGFCRIKERRSKVSVRTTRLKWIK